MKKVVLIDLRQKLAKVRKANQKYPKPHAKNS